MCLTIYRKCARSLSLSLNFLGRKPMFVKRELLKTVDVLLQKIKKSRNISITKLNMKCGIKNACKCPQKGLNGKEKQQHESLKSVTISFR